MTSSHRSHRVGPKSSARSQLPLYRNSIDWDRWFHDYPAPDIFAHSTFLFTPAKLRGLQDRRFLEIVKCGWKNSFYRARWKAAGLEPGDVRSLEDIGKLPTFTSEDVKESQAANPPFGDFHDIAPEAMRPSPLKIQQSGGTTGIPRAILFEPIAWEAQALTQARALYLFGARPGDVMQIPMTCSMANAPWAAYKACHDYLGVIPLTTGSGTVLPSRQQLEAAFRYGTTIWASFPEYLIRLSEVCSNELGRDVLELKTKFIKTYLGPDVDGSLRRDLQERWGCPVYDAYGTNEIGTAAFECQHQRGLHFMEDCVYIEIVDVDTGLPMENGQRGDLVVTALYRTLPPIIRYNLRDLGRILSDERCECGSYFRRMDHLLGRSDAMVKLRGVNVYPMACLPAIKSDARTTGEWLCVVERTAAEKSPRDVMEVRVEVRASATDQDGLRHKLEQRLRDDLGVTVAVKLVEEGTLAIFTNVGQEGKARRLLDLRNQNPLRERT